MTTSEPLIDGRRARRERSRVAVIDALLDLVADGRIPTAPDIAERAGVSLASLFRYFEGLDDLQHQALRRYVERFAGRFELTDDPSATTEERIEALVAGRLRLHAETEPFARFTRARALTEPAISSFVDGMRQRLHDQTAHHLGVEPDSALAGLATALTSFEAWDQLRRLGWDDERVRALWVETLRGAPGAPDSDN